MSRMIEKAYRKAADGGYKQFSTSALYIADKYCEFPNGGKDTIVWSNAVDMALGAELVKRKYIITGVVIGVVCMCSIQLIRKNISKEVEAE